MVKPVVINICDTWFMTAKDSIYIKQTGGDNSEGRMCNNNRTRELEKLNGPKEGVI
jgi:hypothetical protein